MSPDCYCDITSIVSGLIGVIVGLSIATVFFVVIILKGLGIEIEW